MKKLIAGALALMMAFSAFGVTTTYEDATVVGTEYCSAGVIYTDDITRTYEVTTEVVGGDTVETRTEISNVPTTATVRDSATTDEQSITDLANTSVDNLDGTRTILHTWNTNVWQEYTELECTGDVVPGSLVVVGHVGTETVLTDINEAEVTIVTTINFVGEIINRIFIGQEVVVQCGPWVPSTTTLVPTEEFDPSNPTYDVVTTYERPCSEVTTYTYEITRS